VPVAAPPVPPPLPAGVVVGKGWTARLLAKGLPGPDDLAALPDGTLYFSDITAGTVGALPPRGGTPTVLAAHLAVPEGIAVLPGGALLVVEQGRNRVLRVDPATGVTTPWLSLANPTNLYGVDGITLAAADLLIPDSPVGILLRQAVVDGRPVGALVRLGGGMHRPTSAVRVGATIYVTDETGSALDALPAGGGAPASIVAHLPSPDDVVAGPGGLLLVACLDGAVRAVDPATGTATPILTGLGSPQGLAPDGSGFAVADEAQGRIYLLRAGRGGG